jgi:recombination DNA repair RAD52 pathway protein
MTDKQGFDPKDHMMQLKGKDYLPVFARLMWLRTEQSGATLETDMVEHEVGKHATFKAKVTLKDGASATGYGTETVQDFRDYLEKAETKAIGRALGALGFGTAFADFVYEKDEPETKVVDSPVQPKQSSLVEAALQNGASQVTPPTPPSPTQSSAQRNGAAPNQRTEAGSITDAQKRAIFAIGRGLAMESEEVEDLSLRKYNKRIGSLSTKEASGLIDDLKAAAAEKAKAPA